jgi:hypothetical protein
MSYDGISQLGKKVHRLGGTIVEGRRLAADGTLMLLMHSADTTAGSG